MQKTRYSKQRELIYQNLKERQDHPSAETIYASLKKEHPELSLGTVYRNLNFLVDTNLIKKLDVGHHMVHFDANLRPHYHFICQQCRGVYDIAADILDTISNDVQKQSEHTIVNANITFHGICKDCQTKKH